jgi:hypothetical protein
MNNRSAHTEGQFGSSANDASGSPALYSNHAGGIRIWFYRNLGKSHEKFRDHDRYLICRGMYTLHEGIVRPMIGECQLGSGGKFTIEWTGHSRESQVL